MGKHFNHLDRIIQFRMDEDLTMSILAATSCVTLSETHVATLGTCCTSAGEPTGNAKRREGNAFNGEEGSDLLAHLQEPVFAGFKLGNHKASEKVSESR
jgi:hypothetical protein